MKKLRRICLVVFVAMFLLCGASVAPATEGGGSIYGHGSVGFMAGAVPPPGTYLLFYGNYYTADKLKGKDGDVPGINNFDLKAYASVFRFVHVTKQQLLGGNLGMHIVLPVVKVDLSFATPGPTLSDDKTGVGDLTVGPLLSWHTKNFHWAVGVDFNLPTGSFKQTDLVNIGRNYYEIEPVFAVTYLTDNGFDLSAKFMYDFNFKNNDTNYLSGQEFHTDYSVGKKFGNLAVGVGGYYYKQITGDELNGQEVNNPVQGAGNKGQVFSYGPQIKYDYKNMYFEIKYQKETMVENRPEGEKFWLNFMYAF